MSPTIISESIQEFLGVRYYYCGSYFQNKGIRLHRKVWEAANGAIPEDHHVHHKDGNCKNNALANLECLPGAEHLAQHAQEQSDEHKTAWWNAGQKAAAKWHGSQEGYEWHGEHYEQHIRPLLEKSAESICTFCKKPYKVSPMYQKQRLFCHANCKARALRARRAGRAY